MKNTHATGDRTEAIIMSKLAQIYPAVLIPFGNGQRYDLVVDSGSGFIRVQCKTGWLRDGVIWFNTSNSGRSYVGEVDYFGVFCPDNNKSYLIPVKDVPARFASLRLELTRNNQSKNIRWAKEYEIMTPV